MSSALKTYFGVKAMVHHASATGKSLHNPLKQRLDLPKSVSFWLGIPISAAYFRSPRIARTTHASR
jgi:hypothetical protein